MAFKRLSLIQFSVLKSDNLGSRANWNENPSLLNAEVVLENRFDASPVRRAFGTTKIDKCV